MWELTRILRRHNGVFAFFRKVEGGKIVMKYVMLSGDHEGDK